MTQLRPLFQIVHRAPGGLDGVGDYARTLADRLRAGHGWESIFLSAEPSVEQMIAGDFRVYSPLRILGNLETVGPTPAILHYVNYGYERNGIPFWLPKALRQIKGSERMLTIFHELYAAGSIRQRAFWLQPLQKRVVRLIADLSETGVVSSEFLRGRLLRLAPNLRVLVQPVISNFGEPELAPTEITQRDPHFWVICGGTELVERSLTSFLRIVDQIPAEMRPQEVFVFGGKENDSIRLTLKREQRFKSNYRPSVSSEEASQIMSKCAFGWIDYLAHADVPLEVILKSSAFAALCAHGVIPVTPEPNGAIARFPGPFFVARARHHLPTSADRGEAANSIYSWYQEHASSVRLAATINAALTAAG